MATPLDSSSDDGSGAPTQHRVDGTEGTQHWRGSNGPGVQHQRAFTGRQDVEFGGNSDIGDQHDLQDYCDFLSENVHRLNHELAVYRKIHTSDADWELASQKVPISGDGPSPDWLTNPKHLAPLISAYDDNIAECKAEIDRLTEVNEKLEEALKGVVQENNSLAEKLAENQQRPVQEANSQGLVQKERQRALALEDEVQHLRVQLQQSKQDRKAKEADIELLREEVMAVERRLEATQVETDKLSRINEDLRTANSELRIENKRTAEYASLRDRAPIRGKENIDRDAGSGVREAMKNMAKQLAHLKKLHSETLAELNEIKTNPKMAKVDGSREVMLDVMSSSEREREQLTRMNQKKDIVIGRLMERLAGVRRQKALSEGESRKTISEATALVKSQEKAHRLQARLLTEELWSCHDSATRAEKVATLHLQRNLMEQTSMRDHYLRAATLIGDPIF
eukprot:m.96088 g.96088  ORF g.96088 m.96088 type:complete len:453 (+) comp13527_c0_seq1:214-1572(+)